MGIIADVSAMSKVQKIKKGGVAKLSISQIVNLIINLPDANKKLDRKTFDRVYDTYCKMRKCKTKIPMNMDVYRNTAIEIIKEFDLIAPYELYSGGAEFEFRLLMKDIFGENHLWIRELKRKIADLEAKLIESDATNAKNAKIYAEAYTDDQLAEMVSRGEFPASRVNEYKENRNGLQMFLNFAPVVRENTVRMIEDLKKELSELELDN